MYPHILKIPFSTLKVWKLVRYPHVFEFQLMPFLLFFPLSLLLGRFPSFFFFCVLLHLLLLHVLFLFLSRQPPVRSLLVVAIGSIDGCLAIPTLSAGSGSSGRHCLGDYSAAASSALSSSGHRYAFWPLVLCPSGRFGHCSAADLSPCPALFGLFFGLL